MSIRKQLIYIGILTLGLVVGHSARAQQPTPSPTSDSLDKASKATEYYYRGVLAQRTDRVGEALDLLRRAHTLALEDPMIAFALGGTYMDTKRQSEALPLLEQAYHSDTTSVTFALALSSAYIAAERMGDALHINEQLMRLDPEDVDVKYRLVQLYARTGDLKQALKMCTELQARFRPYPEAYSRLTQIKIQLLELTQDKKAIEAEYEAQVSLYPEERKYYYDLFLYLVQEGRLQEATKRLATDVRRQRVRSGDAHALRAHLYIAQKDYERAEQELAELNRDPQIGAGEKYVLWSLLSNSITGEEKILDERYMPRIKELLTVHPEDLAILRSYVQLLRYREHYQEAVELLRPQTQIHPETPWIWDELFQDAVGLSQDTLMVEVAREALRYVPEDWRYYIAIASDDFTGTRFPEAIQTLERGAAAIEPKTGGGAARLYGLLADLYAQYGTPVQRGQADSLYRRAIEANPNDPDVLNNYAYRLAKAGRELELAEQYAGQAVKLSPEAAHILDTYAYILYLRGNYTLAKLYQRKSLEQAGEQISADMYDHMGDILAALGERDEALSYYTQALQSYEQQDEPEERALVEAKITALDKDKVKPSTPRTKKSKR